jgi:hypothetical protein
VLYLESDVSLRADKVAQQLARAHCPALSFFPLHLPHCPPRLADDRIHGLPPDDLLPRIAPVLQCIAAALRRAAAGRAAVEAAARLARAG